MKIKFLNIVKPTDLAVASARTCYYPEGIITPEKTKEWSKKNKLLKSIFKAGHHTTLQHSNITLLIEGISRHLIWRLLHSHSFYNSEQVSQRYAKMKEKNFVYPANSNKDLWSKYYAYLFNTYQTLSEVLIKDTREATPKYRQKDVEKKAQEIARYVLPLGTSAYLYHTVNISVLLRYIAISKVLPEAGAEAKEFARLLEENLLNLDEDLKVLINYAKKAKAVYPKINLQKLKNKYKIKEEDIVKIFDINSDMDFDINENYADILRLSQISFDEGIIGGFSSYLKLSLSADAQNQRHRRSLAIRPLIKDIYKRDYYIPNIIKNNKNAYKIYKEAIDKSYDFYEEQAKSLGEGESIYALLNAHNIQIIERSDFSSYHHKAQMRLCFNAQEEIYDLTYEQVKLLRQKKIKGSDKLLPPCKNRKILNISPPCPEGDKFCGIKVWDLNFDEFKRKI